MHGVRHSHTYISYRISTKCLSNLYMNILNENENSKMRAIFQISWELWHLVLLTNVYGWGEWNTVLVIFLHMIFIFGIHVGKWPQDNVSHTDLGDLWYWPKWQINYGSFHSYPKKSFLAWYWQVVYILLL